MRYLRLLIALLLAAPATALAQSKLNIVSTTEDLGAIAREIGGDKVSVTALAKGYQDPHFVDPKPSFILAVSRADVLMKAVISAAHCNVVAIRSRWNSLTKGVCSS